MSAQQRRHCWQHRITVAVNSGLGDCWKMSLLRDATGVGFVWPPARAGWRGRGARRGRRTLRSVRGWFWAMGRDGGSDAGSERAGCAGASLTAKSGGQGVCVWRRWGRAASCFVFELVMAWYPLHQGVNLIYSVERWFCYCLQPRLTPACTFCFF